MYVSHLFFTSTGSFINRACLILFMLWPLLLMLTQLKHLAEAATAMARTWFLIGPQPGQPPTMSRGAKGQARDANAWNWNTRLCNSTGLFVGLMCFWFLCWCNLFNLACLENHMRQKGFETYLINHLTKRATSYSVPLQSSPTLTDTVLCICK